MTKKIKNICSKSWNFIKRHLWFLFLIFALIGIIIVIVSFCYLRNDPVLWSAIISCSASLAFSAIISWIVQRINDKSAQNRDLNLKKNIRELVFSPVRKELNEFMRYYYLREDQLVNKIPNIKLSISENGIDIENITKNLFIFELIDKNYSKYSFLKKEDEKFVKINIGNCQIISQDMNTKYENLSKICKSCYENMERENIYNNLDIFTKFEIKTIKKLSYTYSFNLIIEKSPSCAIEIIKEVNEVFPFIKPDVITFYKKVNLSKFFDNEDKFKNENDKKYDEWYNKKVKEAETFLINLENN